MSQNNNQTLQQTVALFSELLHADSNPQYDKQSAVLSLSIEALQNLGEQPEITFPSGAKIPSKLGCMQLALGIKVASRNAPFIPLLMIPCVVQAMNATPYVKDKAQKSTMGENVFAVHPDISKQATLAREIVQEGNESSYYALTDITRYQTAQTAHPYPNTDAWQTWIAHAFELFMAATGCPITNVMDQFSQFRPGDQFALVFMATKEANAVHVTQLYKSLTSQLSTLPLTPLKQVMDTYNNAYQGQSVHGDGWLKTLAEEPTFLLGHMDETTDAYLENPTLAHREMFPLDNTQRKVNVYAAQLNTGDVLAVNGPPGSGKTAMLRAVIANQWVRAALHKGECPITFAVGDTNQSVTNVISAFSKVAAPYSDKVDMYQRWLPCINNYGSFFPSKSKLDKDYKDTARFASEMILARGSNKDYHVFGWKGDAEVLSNPLQAPVLSEYYINQAVNAGLIDTPEGIVVDDVLNALHARLRATYNLIKDTHNVFYEYLNSGAVCDLQTLLSASLKLGLNSDAVAHSDLNTDQNTDQNTPQRPQVSVLLNDLDTLQNISSEHISPDGMTLIQQVCRETLRDDFAWDGRADTFDKTWCVQLKRTALCIVFDRLLDVTFRAELFHIAARYWEGRYIIAQTEHILLEADAKNITLNLQHCCMLTPCLVATLDNLPSIFKVKAEQGCLLPDYVWGCIDQLIVDESGQATIAKALPSLALAKKVIAVGDVKQLQPVINLDRDTESTYYISHGFTTKQFITKHAQSLTNGSGSLLHLLREASTYSERDKGLMLRGHYRCDQEIIELCNKMVYENALFYMPKRTPKNNSAAQSTFLPALSYVCSDSKNQRSSGSQANVGEAEKVVRFIMEQWPAIRAAFPESKYPKIGDIIGIISPYKKQPEVIKNKLVEALQQYQQKHPQDTEYFTVADCNAMMSGTVNSLQGAEKPIILFSGVISEQTSSSSFFAEHPFLLNVALSRAQKHFVAFVCPHEYGMDVERDFNDPSAFSDVDPKQYFVQYTGQYLRQFGTRLFPNHLVVIEAPGKVATLNAILGQDYDVLATAGTTHEMCSDVDLHTSVVPLRYGLLEDKQPVLEQIIRRSRLLDHIVLATDADNAGENIAWHLEQQIIQLAPELAHKIYHVRLGAMTENAVGAVFKHLESQWATSQGSVTSLIDVHKKQAKTVTEHVVMTEASRDILDKLMAQRFREVLTEHFEQTSAAQNTRFKARQYGLGRVKVAVLATLLASEQAHAKNPKLDVTLYLNQKVFKARVDQSTLPKVISGMHKKGETQVQFSRRVQVLPQQKQVQEVSSPVTSTANVLAAANAKLGFTPAYTMQLLQRLYDGI